MGYTILMIAHGLQGNLLGVRAVIEEFNFIATGIMMSGYFVGYFIGANVIPDQCSLEWEVRPINKDDGDFVSKNIDSFAKDILLPEMKKNNPKGNIKKEIIGEVVGFNKEEKSEAANLVCNLTGDNAKETMSFGTEAGLFQNSGISTVICGPGSIEQAHTVDEYITFDQLKKCLKMLISLQEKMVN